MDRNDWFVAEHEVGQPLRFNFITGVSIGCAAFLLEGGVKRESVRAIMTLIGEVLPASRTSPFIPPMTHAILEKGPTVAQVADGRRVRWLLGQQDTGWVDPLYPFKADENYSPRVVVSIDFGAVRESLKK